MAWLGVGIVSRFVSYLEEEELVAEDGREVGVLRGGRGREGGEEGRAEGVDVGGRDDALAVERGEVEDPVEGVLLPLEGVGVAARGGLVGGEAAAGPGEDGLAQRRDGVLQARVVRRRVRVPHRRRGLACLVVELSRGGRDSETGRREKDLVRGRKGEVWFCFGVRSQRLGVEELAVEVSTESDCRWCPLTIPPCFEIPIDNSSLF